MTGTVTVERRPTRVGSAVAILAAAGAVGLVADGSDQLLALGVEVAGLAAVGVGLEARRRGHRGLGLGVACLGAVAVLLAFRFGVVLPSGIPARVVLLAGLVGTAVLGGGLLALRPRWARRVATLGAAVVGVGALAAGALGELSPVPLFAAVAAAMVAWDAAEHAVGLGEQVGRDADTASVELVHSAASAVAGTVAVGLAAGATSVDAVTLPLAGVVALVSAAVALVLALYR